MQVVTPTGAFGGAVKRCTEWRGRMWSQPQWPSVGPPLGPRSGVLGCAGACDHSHWRLRWSS
eukprot:9179836-Pyramimonas_sp.AAC.1